MHLTPSSTEPFNYSVDESQRRNEPRAALQYCMKSTEHRTNKGQFTLGTDRYAYPLQSNLTKAIRMDTGVSVARCILIHTADRETDRQAAAYVLLPS